MRKPLILGRRNNASSHYKYNTYRERIVNNDNYSIRTAKNPSQNRNRPFGIAKKHFINEKLAKKNYSHIKK